MAAKEPFHEPQSRCRPRLVVLAKEPRPGQVKTRLVPPLDFEMAAECHRAFVSDTLGRLTAAFSPRISLRLAVTPSASSPTLRALARAHAWPCRSQGDGDLGARMRRQLAWAGPGPEIRIVVGSDSPDLPLSHIAEALEVLERRAASVVVGPSSDGGYYLLGVRGAVPDLFTDMRWSESTVGAETVKRLAAAGVAYHVLRVWHDVDDWNALVALADRLKVGERENGVSQTPACDRLIDALRRRGFSI